LPKRIIKLNRGLRTEATINNPLDFGVGKDLSNWAYLRQLGAAMTLRLLDTERVSEDCLLSAESFAHVSEPTTTETGQRAPGLRFGQPRVMALFAALSRFAPALNGFDNADVRETVQALLNISPDEYTASQMSYDLRRLRWTGRSFRGHVVSNSRAHPGEAVQVETCWQVTAQPGRPLSLMLHRVAPDGKHIVADGLGVPIEQWQVGDVIVQRHRLALPSDVPAGRHQLLTGAYWLDTLERWPVLSGDTLTLSPIVVEPRP